MTDDNRYLGREVGSNSGRLVTQFPTPRETPSSTESTAPWSRNPYRLAPPRPPSAEPLVPPEPAEAKAWPLSVSRDEPDKLSSATRSHTFFVRTKRERLMANIDVLGFIAKCPDVGDGEGVVVHRDVITSLAYHLIDKVHELETLRKGLEGRRMEDPNEPRYDEKLSRALDTLGDRDADIKELRAALGEAAVKIRRLESKLFK
jgi:hypothetical protein